MKISEQYRKLQKLWNQQAKTGVVKDDENPLFIFALTNTKLLKEIATGKLDVGQLALMELEGRNQSIRTYYSYNEKGRRVKVTIPD